MATAPQHIAKSHPFAVMTAVSIPESLKSPRERNMFGWETLKVKQFIRVPIADGYADSAYMSMMNFNKKKETEWTEARDKELSRIMNLDEVKSVEEDDARAEQITTRMAPWYEANGEEPVRFGHQPAVDSKGKLVRPKKGGTVYEFVNYDSEDGAPLLKDKRDNEKPAFKDFIRIV